MRKDISILLVLILMLGVGGLWLGARKSTSTNNPKPEEGQVVLRLGESATVGNLVLKPLRVVEDSRCPANVQCIQAGTVRVLTEVVSGSGTSNSTIELGKSINTATEELSLSKVIPETKSSGVVSSSDYSFTYNVKKRSVSSGSTGGCYVGGCSGQICSSEPNVVSTCEYTAAYACYKTAKCERQNTGECGWTDTAALRMCLSNAASQPPIQTLPQ